MRLSEIDDSNRGDHMRLVDGDNCLFLFEYTSGRDYTFSATNDLINNLKKKPTASQAQLGYKNGAIIRCATTLRDALNPAWLDTATIIPVPGSKAADHPDYDNRMERVAKLIRPGLDVRNLVIQDQSTTAAHEAGFGGDRVTVDELTAGTHFRAMKTVLAHRFPTATITGLFIARRVFPPAALDFQGVDIDF